MNRSILLLSLFIALLSGISPLVIRVMSKTVSHHTVMAISAIVYFVSTMIYIYLFHYDTVLQDIQYTNYIFIIILTSFVGFFLASSMYFYALKHTDNVNYVVIITSLYPVVTLILSYYFLDEKLTWQGLLGFVFVIIGIVLLFSHTTK